MVVMLGSEVVDFELLVAELVVLESDVESVYDQGV